MKNGLAIWHYPHRSVLENVSYFAKCGFDSVSIHGNHMLEVCSDKESAKKLAELIKTNDLILTVHHKLPENHSEECVHNFRNSVELISEWQNKYGCLSILSFDVPQSIRDNITPYIDYVLEKIINCKVAVEDFGLNEAEKSQIEHLKGNDRFGYLLDIGHMYIRMCGKNESGLTLFSNSVKECPVNEKPELDDFLNAFYSKDFPVFEIHLHNNDGKEDKHYFLEDGTLKIEIIADVLRRVGFNGVLTIESAPGFSFKCEYPESDLRINETYSYWKKLNT